MGALNSKDVDADPDSWKKQREAFDEKQRATTTSTSSMSLGLQLHEDAAVLDNLDERAVKRLWDNFIREADSFAVDQDQLSRTFLGVRCEMVLPCVKNCPPPPPAAPIIYPRKDVVPTPSPRLVNPPLAFPLPPSSKSYLAPVRFLGPDSDSCTNSRRQRFGGDEAGGHAVHVLGRKWRSEELCGLHGDLYRRGILQQHVAR